VQHEIREPDRTDKKQKERKGSAKSKIVGPDERHMNAMRRDR
jgi:hypothetical protein